MKKILGFIVGCFIVLLSFNVFASTNNSIQANKPIFDTENASKEFATTPSMKIKSLHAYIDKIESLQDDAKDCIKKSDEQLKVVNDLLKEAKLEHGIQLSKNYYEYFQGKRLFYAKQRSECQLFLHQSQEALLHYKGVIQKLNSFKILKRSVPIWEAPKKEVLLALKTISIQKIHLANGTKKITWSQLLLGLALLGIGVLIAIYIRILCIRWLSKHPDADPPVASFFSLLAAFVIPVVVFGIIAVFLHVIFFDVPAPSLELISRAVLVFIGLFALSKYLFYPPRGLPSFIELPSALAKSLHRWVVVLLSWIFLGYLVAAIFEKQVVNQELIELVRSLFISVLSVLTVWLLWLFCRIPKLEQLNHSVASFIKSALVILFLSVLVAECLGYHQLAIFIISGVILTIVLFGITMALWHFIGVLYQCIDDNKYSSAKKMRYIFGVKTHRKLNEILLIRFSAYVALICAFFIGLMKIWSVPVSVVDMVEDGLLSGFTLIDLKIVPLNILVALVSFTFILLVGRFSAATIMRKRHFKGEQEMQVAVASIIVYIAFGIGLLFALLIIGVNFTGLAIIAGALSVGIGLGLQNIVNNFVSGIILLLEKPVKTGDRVVVGDTEGFVKKVRIRSTQITTLAKEDVIFPNADLITNKVTNYMFRDRNWRVVCKVGVAYGSNIELVKKVLLDVASKHADVLQDAPNQPVVLFRNFGDSSLLFELWSIITDVNKKFIVESDLNFAIDAAFRQNGITIAFPQRDVHIKENIVVQEP